MEKVTSVDIGQMASASDVVFEALREAIITGKMRDGESIRQDAVARMFNVSRIPVREALTRLEDVGLVTMRRYHGAVVSSLSVDDIEELYQFRALLEADAIRHAVPRLKDETIAEAKAYADAFSRSTNSTEWGTLNRHFHYTLYRDCERPYFLQAIGQTLDRVNRYLRAQLMLTDGMVLARAEHLAILDACIARDAEVAARLTHAHIVDASASLVRFLANNPAMR